MEDLGAKMGAGVQAHINTLRSRGFEPGRILVDPFKSLMALQGAFPGVEIDPAEREIIWIRLISGSEESKNW
jgi:hypothetical protein